MANLSLTPLNQRKHHDRILEKFIRIFVQHSAFSHREKKNKRFKTKTKSISNRTLGAYKFFFPIHIYWPFEFYPLPIGGSSAVRILKSYPFKLSYRFTILMSFIYRLGLKLNYCWKSWSIEIQTQLNYCNFKILNGSRPSAA